MRRTALYLATILAIMFVGSTGACRNHMPHSFTWPAGGDTVQSHPKPPEGGYYSNWDPYAAELTLTPLHDLNPVQTQHVMVATITDAEGKPLPNRRVEWIISEGSVGDIVEVDESGFRASRGYKVDNHFAVSHTANFTHVLDRGNDDPSDDIHLEKGQTWCVITSPIEGETHITAYAPAIYDWSKHKVFAKKVWSDVAWEFPERATNPTGTTHEFVTWVGKHSDGSPLQGYDVTYQIVGGPDAVFESSGNNVASLKTDAAGFARVVIKQVSPVEGTNEVKIDIVRPADLQCCKPAVPIATGTTAKTWVAPRIEITKDAPARKLVNETFRYDIRVSNPSQVAANDVVVTDVLPDGIAYVSSNPSANVSGQQLTWSLGTLAANGSGSITVDVKGTRTGSFDNCAEVVTARGLTARDCATTVISAPALALSMDCTSGIIICEPAEYVVSVKNTGDGPATNVRIRVDLDDCFATVDGGQRSVTVDAGTLEPGQSKQARFRVKASKTGPCGARATATADGGLTADADCQTVVTQPVLEVVKTGPKVRYIGRNADYQITVTNTGDSPARDTVLVDNVPAGTRVLSVSDQGSATESTVTWQLGTIQSGQSRTVTMSLKTSRAGTLRNTATAKAFCAEATSSVETQVKGIPAILLEVIDLEDPIEVGSTTTYVITVTNQGSAVGTNINIVCELPPEETYVSSDSITQGSLDGRTLRFAPLPSLAPKQKATYRVVIKGAGVGDVRFKVSLTSDQMTSPAGETESTHIY